MVDGSVLQRIDIVKDNTTASKLRKDAAHECKAGLTHRRHPPTRRSHLSYVPPYAVK
jgi:hypothetical protein